MGATLDETRVELEAQRARARATAENLQAAARRSLDIRGIVLRNPARTVAVVGGLAFILLGGPRRTVRQVRHAVRGTADADRAYAALPSTLRALVDETAPGGAGRDEARGAMALALHAWREDPKNRKRADRLVSETLTPPGPERAFWSFTEAVAVAGGALVARQIMARALTGIGRGSSRASTDALSPSEAPPVPRAADPKPTTRSAQYSGWSGRHPSPAGPEGADAAPGSSRPAAPAAPTPAKSSGDHPG